MNIIELEELAKEWDRFDEGNEYSQSFLELIAAYRESIFCLAFANSELKDIYSDTEGKDFNSLRMRDSIPKKQAKDRRHKDCKSI